jgi:two-component system response regulator
MAAPGGFILLVEDNPDDEALTLRALQKGEAVVEVVVVRDGAEALDYLFGTGSHAGRDTGAIPRVVLMDLHLPKVDGLEVLRRLRADERTRCLPVVILSTTDESREVAASYDAGANSYVRKPVGFRELSDVLPRIALYWLRLNEPPPPRKGLP